MGVGVEADNGWRSRVTLELLYFSAKTCLILKYCRGLGSCLRVSQPRMLLLSWALLGAQIMEDVQTSSMALVLASTLQLLFRLVSFSTGWQTSLHEEVRKELTTRQGGAKRQGS